MVRTTSIIAYNDLKSSGKQPTQKQIILNALREINAVSGRVNDLKKSNQVVEARTRKCSITRKTITPVRALRF